MMSPSGGKRDGAGRRPVFSKKVRCNVVLSVDVLEILQTLCDGNRSAAIEFVSRQWDIQDKKNKQEALGSAKTTKA